MATSIRVAGLGAGLMGRLHARVVAECTDTELGYIGDAEATARQHGTRLLSGFDRLFEAGLRDAVIVVGEARAHCGR